MLQTVQSFACRIVSGRRKYDHVFPALKCLWTENCFSLVLKFALKKYTFPKFDKPRLKIDDFTSLQIRVFLLSKMVFESRGQNTTWYQLLTSLWCYNRSRNMADKKEKRQRGRYYVAGTPNQQSCSRNRWTCVLPYSLTCQQETLTAQINSWHQSDVTAWSFWINLDPFPWPFSG